MSRTHRTVAALPPSVSRTQRVARARASAADATQNDVLVAPTGAAVICHACTMRNGTPVTRDCSAALRSAAAAAGLPPTPTTISFAVTSFALSAPLSLISTSTPIRPPQR